MREKLLLVCALFLVFSIGAWAQSRTITGKVVDEKNQPMPGVTVVVKSDPAVGTITDGDGGFTLKVGEKVRYLVFSFIGYSTVEASVDGVSELDINMEPGSEKLSEVVVQAYGTNSERKNIQSISTIEAKNLSDVPVVNVQELLQGQAAGVQMVGASGVAGAQQNVRIRGVASITAGTQPLYVVDGVPLNDASGIDGGGYTSAQGGNALNPLQDINPQDIESISVLKDASATALYGSRGSNGVVLITTKKGARGEQTRFNFDYYTGVTTNTAVLDVMDADQFRQYRSDFLTANGVPTSPADLPQGGFDWFDAAIGTGVTNNYHLSARGGTEKTAFFISGTYFDQESFTIGNEIQKLNGRFNLSHQASDWVKFGFNLGISNVQNDRISVSNSTFAPYTVSGLQTPWVEPRDDQGNFVNTGFIQNIVGLEDLETNILMINRTTGNTFVELTPTENITVRSSIGIDRVMNEEQYRSPDVFSPGGFASNSIVQDNKWLTTNTINYNNIYGDHAIDITAGQSYETSEYRITEVAGSGFISDDLPTVASAAEPTTTNAAISEWGLASFFGRGRYSYKDRYLFEASIRADGSSRFGEDNRYGTFGAVSAGWILTEEEFFKDISYLNFLKVSASYGTTGNDRIGNFASRGLFGAGRDYNGAPGIEATQPANPGLSWESTSQIDFTVSAKLFDSRLQVEASYWRKESTELLLDEQLPTTTGFLSRTGNIGEMVNKGIDLSITSTNIQAGDFKWVTNLNLGTLDNEVTSLPQDNVDVNGDAFVAGTGQQRATVGRSLNEFYLIRYSGVDPQTGDAQWLDADGGLTSTPTSGDRKYVGSALPDLTGGLRNTFTYKNFELEVLLNFQSGNTIFVDDFTFMYIMGGTFNKSTRMLDYWRQPGDQSFAPALNSSTANSFSQDSDLMLVDGGFVRLRYVRLSYNLPRKLLEKSGFLTRVQVYAMGQNLATMFSDAFDLGVDPEVSRFGNDSQAQGESFFNMPQPQTYTFGVKIGF